MSMEAYARATGKVAADLGADVVVGHSYGANIALEMAALGVFSGPIVLLSASFSREDEAKALGVLDKIGRLPLLGPLVWRLALKSILGQITKSMKSLPQARVKALAAEMAKNDPGVCRANVKLYFAYLDHHKNLAPRLCDSGVKAWVVFGTDDEVGLKDEERATLEACPGVTMATVEGTHMFLVETPGATAKLVADAVAAVG
ncbi:MAG: alpha/beta hydrolase [Acidimicrobiia bacterium]|nr:alpha/beta hydrolase [Acidimicrobiia bacterium]